MGSQPSILPSVEQTDAVLDDTVGGSTRSMHILRAIASHTGMVDTTARERTRMVLRSIARITVARNGLRAIPWSDAAPTKLHTLDHRGTAGQFVAATRVLV